MPVIEKELDSWGNTIYGLPYSLYLYYLDNALDFDGQYSSILGNMTGLVSLVYTPFHTSLDLNLIKIPYDTKRFGEIDKLRPELTTQPMVFRINNLENPSKNIASFKTYKVNGKNVGGRRNWRNESKLYNYPYSYIEVSDGLNNPLMLRPELCPTPKCDLLAKLTISERCTHSLFVQNYKGDTHGYVEAMVSTDGNELPSTEGQYASWAARNKNQVQQNVTQSLLQSKMGQQFTAEQENFAKVSGTINAIGGVLGGIASLNIGGAISSGIGGITNYYQREMNLRQNRQQGVLDRQGIIQSALAQSQDMRTAPNTLISQGSNIMYGIRNNDMKLKLYRYGITEEYAQKLGDYFAMFGYKQNKMMDININSRYFYNYIKTVDINIKTNKIPNLYLNMLKSIFDNGVTIWHIDNDGVDIGDYTLDNWEV